MNETSGRVPELASLVTCPECGHGRPEMMPTDACVRSYECRACHAALEPRAGDCCVFCSYGSVPCPSAQSSGKARQARI